MKSSIFLLQKRLKRVLKFKKLLLYVLSLSLLQHHIMYFAYARDGDEEVRFSEEQARELVNYSEQIEELNESFRSYNNPQHKLDTFHLLRQGVADKRREKIDAEIKALKEKDYHERLQELHHNIDSAEDLNMTKEEKARYIDFLRIQIDDLTKRGPYGTEVDTFIDEALSRRHYFKNNLQIHVYGVYSSTLKEKVEVIKEADFARSTSPNFNMNFEGFNRSTKAFEDYHFAITSKKGEALNEFYIPTDAIGFYGDFLVFVEKGSYDKEAGVLPLRFVNMKYFRGNIGNAQLPIYSLPLKTDSELNEFSIKNGKLSVNGVALNSSAFQFLSDFYTVMYNVTASLVDPKTTEQTKILMEEMILYFDRSLEAQDEQSRRLVERAVGGDEKLRQIVGDSIDEAKKRAELGGVSEYEKKRKEYNKLVEKLENELEDARDQMKRATTEKEIERAQEWVSRAELDLAKFKAEMGKISNPELEQALKKIATESSLFGAFKDVNLSAQVSRKFMSRLHMFIGRLAQPHPYGAARITEALALVATGISTKDRERVNAGVDSIKAHPYTKFVKFGAGVTAAAVLGSQLPEPYAFDMYDILDLSSTMMSQAKGYILSTNFGLDYLNLLGQSAAKIAQGAASGFSPYIGEGLTGKFAIGMGHVALIPFLVFAIPHLFVNSLKTAHGMFRLRRHNAEAKTLHDKVHEAWGKYTELYRQGGIRGIAQHRLQSIKDSRAQKIAAQKILNDLRLTNSEEYKLVKQTMKDDKRQRSLIQTFIDYQARERLIYDELAAEAENEKSGADLHLTPEQKKQLQDHLRRLKETESNTVFSRAVRLVNKPKNYVNTRRDSIASSILKTADALEVRVGEETTRIKFYRSLGRFIEVNTTQTKDIDTFGKAFRQFMLSYPTVTNTFGALATVWNYVFITRSFVFRPSTWYMIMASPGFFNSVTSRFKGRLHIPTHYNGGLRPHWTYWPIRIGNSIGMPSMQVLRRAENNVLLLEKQAFDIAVRRAQTALVHEAKDPQRMLHIFDSTMKTASAGESTTGIANLTDKKLKTLSPKERTFFRAYFNKSFEEIMKRVLIGEIQKESNEYTEAELYKMSSRQLAKASRKQISEFGDYEFYYNLEKNKAELEALQELERTAENQERIDELITGVRRSDEFEKRAKVLAQQAERAIEFDKVVLPMANSVTNDFSQILTRKSTNRNHKLYNIMDPRGMQMSRFSTVREKKQQPKAMGRAVRSEVSTFLVSLPITLLSTLLFYSAMTGELMPFNPAVSHSETHTWYMSRYLFYQGFMSGVIIGIFANTWMKIQMDDRIDNTGSFYAEPLHADQKRGFWRYFFKSTWKHPNNKWKDNHLHYLKLITANIPAALVTFSTVYFLTLGRFDLGAFAAGYIVYYLTPLMGINLKIEQGFELASKWVNGKIPAKYRADRAAQDYINTTIQMNRNKFTFFFTFYETVQGKILSAFELMQTEQYGTRSFLRLFFYGWTPTELVAQTMRKMAEFGDAVPGVRRIAETIEYLFTNNYAPENWEKIGPNPRITEASSIFEVIRGTVDTTKAASAGAASSLFAMAAKANAGSDILGAESVVENVAPACQMFFGGK